MNTFGKEIYEFIESVWSYCRSITGEGLRNTLLDIKKILPELSIIEIESGKKVLDWEIPLEWNIQDAWVKDQNGNKIIDFNTNNLHVIGYCAPFQGIVSREALFEHLYVLEEQPEAIPYVTSYYKERWGFCVSKEFRDALEGETFQVYIESTLEKGSLTLGELIIPGDTHEEVLFSTYCCHPSLANDQLSGVGLSVFLAKWILSLPRRKYTYRFVFIPEIIGSAAYISLHKETLIRNTTLAFNLTCVGDNRTWSYLPSRKGDTLADKIALNLLKMYCDSFTAYTWNDRGSDESMFSAPGIDLPMVSIMRSKYGTFPEYHTSEDVMGKTVTAEGLEASFLFYQKLITSLEFNYRPKARVLGEPQLGKRGLYPDLSMKGSSNPVKDLLNIYSYCDGDHDIYDISNKAQVPVLRVIETLKNLQKHDLV